MNEIVFWCEIGASFRRAGMPLLLGGVSCASRATSSRNSNAVRKADCCFSDVPNFRMWSGDRGIRSCLKLKRGFVRLEKISRTKIRLIETFGGYWDASIFQALDDRSCRTASRTMR